MEIDISQMASVEIEEHISDLEVAYAEGLAGNSDIHYLNGIWRRIKDLRRELEERSSKN
jgi:hypothetical protein